MRRTNTALLALIVVALTVIIALLAILVFQSSTQSEDNTVATTVLTATPDSLATSRAGVRLPCPTDEELPPEARAALGTQEPNAACP